MTMRSQLRSSD